MPPCPAVSNPSSPTYCLAGATASGKTAVAQALAERLGLPILSADAMLVYAGMDIGTAKPTAAERGAVPYFGLDLVTPGEDFSAAAWLAEARRAQAASPTGLIVAGGTGLYFSALLRGLDPTRLYDHASGWQDKGGGDASGGQQSGAGQSGGGTDTAAFAGFFLQKIPLVAGTGLDLRLEHPRAAKRAAESDPFGLVRRICHTSFGNFNAVAAENFFCLIFVDVHLALSYKMLA